MVSCAQCTRCNATVLLSFVLTLGLGTCDLLQPSLPLNTCGTQKRLKVWLNSRIPCFSRPNRSMLQSADQAAIVIDGVAQPEVPGKVRAV